MVSVAPWRPRRFLDPDLAQAVAKAKEQSGMSWREIGARIGVAHGHLVMISKGCRVPSVVVAELIGEVLPIDDETLERLMQVAVVGHGRSRHHRPGVRSEEQD